MLAGNGFGFRVSSLLSILALGIIAFLDADFGLVDFGGLTGAPPSLVLVVFFLTASRTELANLAALLDDVVAFHLSLSLDAAAAVLGGTSSFVDIFFDGGFCC